MQAKKKRLTLDMDAAFQRRLKATAALKGVSMRQYCLTAIEGELDKDEVDSGDAELEAAITDKSQRGQLDIDGLRALRKEIFRDRVLPGNSADLLREARAIKDSQLGSDDKPEESSGSFGIDEVLALRDEIFGDKVLPGNSADLIREARAIRDAEIEGWA